MLPGLWEYKEVAGKSFNFIATKVIEPLTTMTKHSRFSQFYGKIPKEERSKALQVLLVTLLIFRDCFVRLTWEE